MIKYHLMVAKFVLSVKTPDDIVPARVLYTGTCKGYVRDFIQRIGRHVNPGGKVYLTECPFTAVGYALKRSRFYRDSPVVLVVDSDKLDGELFYTGDYETKALNLGSFLIFEPPPGDFNEMRYRDILRIEARITHASDEEVRQEVTRSLGLT